MDENSWEDYEPYGYLYAARRSGRVSITVQTPHGQIYTLACDCDDTRELKRGVGRLAAHCQAWDFTWFDAAICTRCITQLERTP